ncbi:tRNA (adenosine(37)-N6)-threonylcarbamoyltransferase complex ATPase subunit type 1 TsaE [Mesorhizobium sp. NBSH29]|uniref:tRNA (adenosine(37)-N6)-threonylcarbamoyltransferase complex ATPase subunit type 1 TsaE n=1 Tax=Mesorhizobium sp. NBSH29 TaxID=2654249 RepID=UPI0018969308|nr:tRNA (adenosine(37)-N6)-threonylcarbamoyltransferase complex ATPase subunit type 1 TsaE [Mesorhizobium sp. NBSH29]QPC86104.1 tRNA (adenosine(37)-N6)-threonylcarbamoyltransferase complex ATPase subunit type 1 TsaE [Mesorhizobium sp. NBSH29]
MNAFTLHLADERATVQLGQDLAAALRSGDVIALHGDLGAGKTTLSRGLIRALTADPTLEVPSPTYTLVQAYAAFVPLQHFDLYRLTDRDELEEVGFHEAGENGIALIEWPEKAGDDLRTDAVHLSLVHDAQGRIATISGPPDALSRIERSLAARRFLEKAGLASADRAYFSGDASARSYETVSTEAGSWVLMNSPRLVMGPPVKDGKTYAQIARTAQTVSAFVAIARMLRQKGISAPQILFQDADAGFVLMENLGTTSFLDADGRPVPERLEAAGSLLAFMHAQQWPSSCPADTEIHHAIPPFDREAMLIEVELLLDWYVPAMLGRTISDAERAAYRQVWNQLIDRLAAAEIGFVHRDFQSPNIVWRGDRSGLDRLGIVDFQDGLIGPTPYDVASLALDARVTMTPELEQIMVNAYVSARSVAGGFDQQAFARGYAIMAAQRNSKILGIFVRLDRRDGKRHYLAHLPRIRGYLRRALEHPDLVELKELYQRLGLLEERNL